MNDQKLYKQIVSGQTANVSFRDLERLVRKLGFALIRQRGSHRIYRHPKIAERLNLQSTGSKAKPYQVRELQSYIADYDLTIEEQ